MARWRGKDKDPAASVPSEGDEVQSSIELLDNVLSEFDDLEAGNGVVDVVASPPSPAATEPDTPDDESSSRASIGGGGGCGRGGGGGHQSEDDGYMSMNGRRNKFVLSFRCTAEDEGPTLELPPPPEPPPTPASTEMADFPPPPEEAERIISTLIPRVSPVSAKGANSRRIFSSMSLATDDPLSSDYRAVSAGTQTTLPMTRHQRPYGWEATSTSPPPHDAPRFGSLPCSSSAASSRCLPPRTVAAAVGRHREVRRCPAPEDDTFSDDSLDELPPVAVAAPKRNSIAWEVPLGLDDDVDPLYTPGSTKVIGRRRRRSGEHSSSSSLHRLTDESITPTGTYVIRKGRKKERKPVPLPSPECYQQVIQVKSPTSPDGHKLSLEIVPQTQCYQTSANGEDDVKPPSDIAPLCPVRSASLSDRSETSPQSNNITSSSGCYFSESEAMPHPAVASTTQPADLGVTLTSSSGCYFSESEAKPPPTVALPSTTQPADLGVTLTSSSGCYFSESETNPPPTVAPPSATQPADLGVTGCYFREVDFYNEKLSAPQLSYVQHLKRYSSTFDNIKSLLKEGLLEGLDEAPPDFAPPVPPTLVRVVSLPALPTRQQRPQELAVTLEEEELPSLQDSTAPCQASDDEESKLIMQLKNSSQTLLNASSDSLLLCGSELCDALTVEPWRRVEVVEILPPLPPSPVEEDYDEYVEVMHARSPRPRVRPQAPLPALPIAHELRTRSMDAECSRISRNREIPADRRTLPSELSGPPRRRTYHKRLPEASLQTSCSLPETPIFARGCDIPRTPHRRAPAPPAHSASMGPGLGPGLGQALVGAELLRLAGGPGRGWYPRHRQNAARPASIEHLDRLPHSGTFEARKPFTLPPNMAPSMAAPKFFHRSPREALRRVTSLLVRSRGNNPKEGKKESLSPTGVATFGEPSGEGTRQKRGFFKNFWKKSRHYSLEHQ